MEDGVRQRAFEPFFTTKDVGRGTGLGLATVYAIVQDHRGWIDCTSAPGAGTTFSVYLPTCGSETALETEPESRQVQGGRETILVVDDEEMVRNMMRRFLERVGYTVLEAVDGKDGLEVFSRERERIDLVLLDLSMPRMSGKEALAEIRLLSPTVKVILFTGYPVGDAQYEGVQGLMRKPIGGSRLLETVRGVLSG